MFYETEALDFRSAYKLLASTVLPRPIAWVVTENEDGSPNAAPYSFFNYFAGLPPVVCLGITDLPHGPPDTFRNLQRSGECVINLVPEHLADAMRVTAIEFPYGVSEVAEAGLRTRPSKRVRPPRIDGSPVALECRLMQTVDVYDGRGRVVMAQVLGIDIDDRALIDADRCYVDSHALRLVGRMESPGGYLRTTDRFSMRTPTVAEWREEQRARAARTQETT